MLERSLSRLRCISGRRRQTKKNSERFRQVQMDENGVLQSFTMLVVISLCWETAHV